MPTPAVTLKLKKFRRRFGIAAPRVTVRSHIDWHWYVVAILVVVFVSAGIAWWLAQAGETAELKSELSGLRQQLAERDQELEKLRAQAGTEQNAMQMERSTQQQLLVRTKQLEQENAALKEDISFFERLVPASGDESSVRVERFRVVQEGAPNRFRYRILIGFQSGKQARDFRGSLQFVVNYSQAGRDQQLVLPGPSDSAADFVVEVRHFLRKDGVIAIPAGTHLKSVEVRIVQGDTVKAQGAAQL